MGVYKYDSTNDELNPIAGSTTYADLAVGSIIPYGGTTPPISFLMCDGLEVPKADYPELYAVIGDAFGSASETTHFKLPDLRECVPVGVGKNITKSIANHDRYNLGQFKDDALGTHDHPLKTVTTATYNTAGVPVGVAVNNTPTSATHGKQVGVNYIIKAKNTGCPSDIGDAVEDLVEDLMDDYQTKDLTSAVEGATTVEGALSALSSNKMEVVNFLSSTSESSPINILASHISELSNGTLYGGRINTSGPYFAYYGFKYSNSYSAWIFMSYEANRRVLSGICANSEWSELKVADSSDIQDIFEASTLASQGSDANDFPCGVCRANDYYTANLPTTRATSSGQIYYTVTTVRESNNPQAATWLQGYQIAVRTSGNQNITYTRTVNGNNGWSSWQRLVTASDAMQKTKFQYGGTDLSASINQNGVFDFANGTYTLEGLYSGMPNYSLLGIYAYNFFNSSTRLDGHMEIAKMGEYGHVFVITNGGEMYIRACNNGTWGAFKKVTTTTS